jgi:hypothetical protein
MGRFGEYRGHCVRLVSIALAATASNATADDARVTTPLTLAANARLMDGKSNDAVRMALLGAHRRLGDPACQRIFSDFKSIDGRRLDEVLAEHGETGQGFLGLLYFYDGSRHLACGNGGRYAFSKPHSRAVFVCGPRFRQKREWNPAASEALIIHELLHALGLGENPPTSVAITAQVLERCGS